MINSDRAKYLSLFILLVAFVAFIVAIIKAVEIVNKTQVSTKDGIYTSYVSNSGDIAQLAQDLTDGCASDLCRVKRLLEYVSNIPYCTTAFQQKKPSKTIHDNAGDCDDKSNLLISLLHALKIEAYLVLVPKHIFVIVPLVDKKLEDKKGLWLNGRKYYILESTAKHSPVGFPLHYRIDEIDTVIEPFENKKIDLGDIYYKL